MKDNIELENLLIIINKACDVIPGIALEIMKKNLFTDLEEFELGSGIDDIISRFKSGQNTHWVDEIVCLAIDTQTEDNFNLDFWSLFQTEKHIMEPLLLNKIVAGLENDFIQWLVTVKRDNRITELFSSDKENIENFDKWIEENMKD